MKLHAPLKRCAMTLLNENVCSSPGFSQTYKFTNNDWNGTISIKGQRNKTNLWGRNCEWDHNEKDKRKERQKSTEIEQKKQLKQYLINVNL